MHPARHLILLPATTLLIALTVVGTAGSADGRIDTLAGAGHGFAGDGGPATGALFNAPSDAAPVAAGGFLIADSQNNRIRRVFPDGHITTVAGTGQQGDFGNGGGVTALQADLNGPSGVAAAAGDGFLIADTGNSRIRRVLPNQMIVDAAGSELQGNGFSGDGGSPTAAQLDRPRAVAPIGNGNFLIADTGNNRIRAVFNGKISTVAGGGFGSPNGGAATGISLNRPQDVAPLAGGGFLIADTGHDRIVKVDPKGHATTVAGGVHGFSGDGARAVGAGLNHPASVTPLSNGGFLIADENNQRIRRVTPLGTIFTIVGSTTGLGGDGGPASAAKLNDPQSVMLTPAGGVLIADTGNSRIRRASDTGRLPGPSQGRSVSIAPDTGSVMVTPTGSPAALPLREPDLVPASSSFDATKGKLVLTAAHTLPGGANGTMRFFEGAFRIKQGTGSDPVTQVKLTAPLTCPTKKKAKASAARHPLTATAAKKKKRRKRHVWGNGHGRYRTKGRYASGTVRGTIWETVDTCTSTTIRVDRGKVEVRDQVHHKTVFVRRGHRYTARKKH